MGSYRYHSETEQLNNNQFLVFKLASLYRKRKNEFESICSYLPFSVYLNSADSLNISFANDTLANEIDYSPSIIVNKGLSLIKRISDPIVLDRCINGIKAHQASRDKNSICSYIQRLRLNQKMSWSFTHKAFIASNQYVNVMHHFSDFAQIGGMLENILDESFVKRNGWEMFSSLSKREKEVMRLIAEGMTSKLISDRLFISKFTVDTHRKNIFRKLQIKSSVELYKLAQAFELVQLP